MNVSDLLLERGLSAFDAMHRLAANFIYEIPLLRGRRDLAGGILGGWQWSGIVSLQSGFPFTVVTSSDYNLDGVSSDRPNPARELAGVIGKGPKAFSDGAFSDPATWSSLFPPAPSGTVPQLGRNTFRGPGFATVDMSLLKALPIREARVVELRTEFFNLFNRVNLRTPSNNGLGAFNATTQRWSNVNFGRSTLAFEGRQIQFALKFRF